MTPRTLPELEAQIRRDLELLQYPTRAWVPPRRVGGEAVRDVVIVGGGQNGVAIAFALRREGVEDIALYDRAAPEKVGPWQSYARMRTLRTPKHVTGPDQGLPGLTPRAWYEARFGAEAWARLGRIPREVWFEYLDWLRGVLDIPVRHGVAVTDIAPAGAGLLRLGLSDGASVLARQVVLATGIEGGGGWTVPAVLAGLPAERLAHTSQPIDFAALKGRRVLVVGGGASAFDNAATALEAGAARVDVLVRRARLPRVNPNRWMEFAGFMRHFGALDDARRWRMMKLIFDMNQPPPQDTYERCARWPGFALHCGAPIRGARMEGGAVVLETPRGAFRGDFVIAGTGLLADLSARPETRRLAPHVALWADRYSPPAGEDCAALAACPYLSPSFQLTPRAGAEDWADALSRVRLFTFAAMPSLAASAGISAMKFAVERAVRGITEQLFVEDFEAHLADLRAYDEAELVMPEESASETASEEAPLP